MRLPTVDEWRNLGKNLDFAGHSIFFRSAGEGPALLLVHGFPTSSWDWCKLWSDLTARFRVVAPDLLGYGFSAKPRAHDYTIAEQADVCERTLRELGIASCHILAHDYGDTVAQELLARQLQGNACARFLSCTLLNGGLFPETHRPLLMQRLLLSPLGPWIARRLKRGRFAANLRAVFGRNTPPTEFEIEALWSVLCHDRGLEALPRLLRYMPERQLHRQRWVGALQAANVPLALINGSADPVSGAHMVARFRELIANKTYIAELPGIGHYPQIEDSAAVLRAFYQFQDSIEALGAVDSYR